MLTFFCRCFTDGQTSLERVVQSRLSSMSDEVGSNVSQWTMSAATGHLRNYVAGVNEDGEGGEAIFDQFVVRLDESSSRRLARQRRIEQRKGNSEYGQKYEILL